MLKFLCENRRLMSQILVVLTKNLLMLTATMSLGYVGILIPSLTDSNSAEVIHFNEIETSWISSTEPIASLLGGILSGSLTEPFGRKWSMVMLTIPSLISWISFYFAEEKWHIFAALALHGVMSGLMEAPVLSYVVEVTEPHLRGTLSATVLVSGSFGFFLEFLIGSLIHWKMAALVSAIVPLLALCMLSQVPETPYWLLSRNKIDEARQSLAWLRGWTSVENVEDEFQNIYQYFKDNVSQQRCMLVSCIGFRKFAKKNFLWPFLIVAFLFAWSNFVGVGTLASYGAPISVTLKAPTNKYFVTVLIGTSQVIGSIAFIFAVHLIGKRTAALLAAFSLCITTASIGLYAYLIEAFDITFADPHPEPSGFGWVAILLLAVYGFIGYCGVRSTPWILTGEVFSNETRSVGCGLATSVNYFANFAANKVYLQMISTLTFPGVYWTYAVISFIGFVIIYLGVPVTEGKTLEEVANHFKGRKELTNKLSMQTQL